ncbi:hypothetical protein FRC17_010106 [Serendipita sp. 399]|nr:hypothetical protein FRC17_010106 [Serendipita sp. 399]
MELPMKAEDESSQLYERFVSSRNEYTSQSMSIINDQWQLACAELRRLQRQAQDMELELEGWKSSQKLTASSLKHLGSTRSQVEEEIRSAKQTLHPIRRVPADIWIDVFKHAADNDFHAYLKHNSNCSLRPTPYILSHVCRSWRQIVMENRYLWCNLVAHPFPVWPSDRELMFDEAISRAGSPLSLVVSLSQPLSWSHKSIQSDFISQPGRRTFTGQLVNNLGQVVPYNPLGPNIKTHHRTRYQLFVDMEGDQQAIVQKAAQIPFRTPFALVVTSRAPLTSGRLHSVWYDFPFIESLTVRNEIPVAPPPKALSSTHRWLSSLSLTIGKFPANFQLDSYLPQTLTKLYIRDNDATSLPIPTTNLQLPRLCVLGINYPAHGFLERVEMKALKTLILYSYDFPGATPTTKPQAVSTYGQLCDIRFEEWSQPKDIIGDSYYGAVGALSRLVQHMPALQSLTFEHSYVDGGALVELISRSEEKEAVESLPKLDQLVLIHTEGITRDHCDELKKTLSQIKVFR